ncbi:MAG: hypothetical protein JNK85_27270 [Verrucomicrobiales bacterium]|nr:hypothetical protein [Verrucomicrobiales bacterium]
MFQPPSTPILVCFAVPQEAAPLRRQSNQETQVLVTGMGSQNARAAIELALGQYRPRFVLTCGFAGGLRPDLQPGQVVFDADPGSPLEQALDRTTALRVRFHCATRIAVSVAEKAQLRNVTGADAVEMESEVIRQVCRGRQIASATVRAISDTATDELPLDFNQLLTARQTIHWGRMVLALARKPSAVAGLMRLQKHCTIAAQQLTALILQVACDSALTTRH